MQTGVWKKGYAERYPVELVETSQSIKNTQAL